MNNEKTMFQSSLEIQEGVATGVELIRPVDQAAREVLLEAIRVSISKQEFVPGLISQTVLSSSDDLAIILFSQWNTKADFQNKYTGLGIQEIGKSQASLIKERFADVYELLHVHSTYGSSLSLAAGQSFITTIDIISYSGKKIAGRRSNLQFNLRNGKKFENQPGYIGTAVLKNEEVSRAVTIGQWSSVEDFLAAVRNTAPFIMKPFFRNVTSLARLNRILQAFGKLLKNRPEYHAYIHVATRIMNK